MQVELNKAQVRKKRGHTKRLNAKTTNSSGETQCPKLPTNSVTIPYTVSTLPMQHADPALSPKAEDQRKRRAEHAGEDALVENQVSVPM